MAKNIHVIGVSGGPSGGKSSFLAVARERFSNLPNWGVITVPEAATLLIPNAGLDMPGMAASSRPRYFETQGQILDTQIALRNIFRRLAELAPEENVLLMEDRPLGDCEAYVTAEEYLRLLRERRLSREAMYGLYDGIIFLRTAAKGAEKFYTTANNAARTEGIEVARALDTLTANAYIGFPRNIRFIGNETDFEGKIQRAVAAVSQMVGLPKPTQIQRKFLINSRNFNSSRGELGVTRSVEIEQMYLPAPTGQEVRIRKRTGGAESSFYQSWKEDTANAGVRLCREIDIDHDTYARLSRQAIGVVRKRRTAMVHDDQYYWVDDVTYPKRVCLLEVELTDENQTVQLPKCLGAATEVTGDPRYRMSQIAALGASGPTVV